MRNMAKNTEIGNFKRKIFIGIPAFLYLIAGRFALAACESGTGLKNPLNSCTFADLIKNIAKIVAQIGVPIAVIAIIWAGFLFISARGNEKKLEDAKRTFFWAIIGTALLLGAWGLAEAISGFFGGTGGL